MSFGQNVAATKIELFKYKKSSQVAVMVQGILDDKRKVLLKNIEEMIEEASKARGGIWDPLQDIYKSVNEAYLALGTNTVDSVAESTPPVMEVDVNVRRVVDVKIPALSVTEKDTKSMPYGFADTNSSIDRGAKQIKELLPKISNLDARKKWIISSLSSSAKIYIDQGASKALKLGKSLLPSGITKVLGTFKKGDNILIVDNNNIDIARALSSFTSGEIDKIKGLQSNQIENILGYASKSEIVHKDDIVIL